MANASQLAQIQHNVWHGSLPLEIQLDPNESRLFDQVEPYLVQYPRLSYLPFLLSKIHAFYHDLMIDSSAPFYHGWFSFDGVPLKWHYPIGLLYDIYSGYDPSQGEGDSEHTVHDDDTKQLEETHESGKLPWKLTVHFTKWPEDQLTELDKDGIVMHDAWVNSVKEADFVRNGTARAVMSLSKEDSTKMWTSVQEHSLPSYLQIYNRLIDAPGQRLRNIPLKIYLPSSANATESTPGSLKVVQAPIPPDISASKRSRVKLSCSHVGEPQTIGTALHSLIPSLFPSRRTAVLAQPLLHGCILPMSALMVDVMRSAAYSDGWIHLGIAMMG